MAKKGPDLTSLVALRRQKTEQAYAALQADIAAAEQRIADLRAELDAGPVTAERFAEHSLSEQYGNTARILARIDTQQQSIAQLRLELAETKESLKRAFHSEQRLKSL